MKERAMRRVSGILLILLLISGMASPALAAARQIIKLIIHRFLSSRRSCPSICPSKSTRAGVVAFLGLSAGFLAPAFAADYDVPVLRGGEPPAPVVTVGPATFTRWSGFYFGGAIGVSSAYSDFSKATLPLVQNSLQHTTVESNDTPSDFRVLGNGSAVTANGGAFLGYNTQWQDLVLGVEATYTHTNLNTTASSAAVARVFPDVSTAVGVSASGNLNLTDYGTARGRAGYVVGNFLPYGFIGMAVGRATYSVSTVTDVTQGSTVNGAVDYSCAGTGLSTPTCQDFFFANSVGQNNALLWGYTVGAGLDWALTPNIFVRGEFEFVQFAPISSISVSVASGRVGAGLKF
jgi:outer membrane immunogenic protein